MGANLSRPTQATVRRWRWIPIAATVVLIIGAGLFSYYAFRDRGSSKPKELISQTQSNAGTISAPTPGQKSPEVQTTPYQRPSPGKSKTSEGFGTSSGPTRDQSTKTAKSLVDIETLYLESQSDPFAHEIERQLAASLTGLNRFVISNNKDVSDAELIIAVHAHGQRRDRRTGQDVHVGTASLQIVNIAGEVIWESSAFQGTVEEIQTDFTRQLFKALEQQSERKKR
jgi:hypothetical protein